MDESRTLVVRLVGSLLAVVSGVGVGFALGATDSGFAVGAAAGALVAALFETVVHLLPRWSTRARSLLDPRAAVLGVWFQDVEVRVIDGVPDATQANRFAVLQVTCDDAGRYAVEGVAYDRAGRPHARFHSKDAVNFSFDGPAPRFSYVFGGVRTAENVDATGVVTVALASRDTGEGRVDHVRENVVLRFRMARITPDWLRRHAIPATTPDALRDLGVRDTVARDIARALEARQDA